VTRPGGLVAAAAISRYAGLLEAAALGRLDDATEVVVRRAITTGRHDDDPHGFTTAYSHLPDELRQEAEKAGLERVTVLGVEGPSAPALDNVPFERLQQLLPSALRAARLLEADPALMAASPHLLAVGVVGRR